MECTVNFLLNPVLSCPLHVFGKEQKQDNRLLTGTACFKRTFLISGEFTGMLRHINVRKIGKVNLFPNMGPLKVKDIMKLTDQSKAVDLKTFSPASAVWKGSI